jgi:GNAT superfamily N-acetyltransferase
MSILFRALDPAEDLAGHAVWMEAYAWLRERAIRQWLVPLPFVSFQKRTYERINYGYFDGSDLLAVVAIFHHADEHWIDVLGSELQWWLSALAVRNASRGLGIGRRVVNLSCSEAAKRGATNVYLDCVEGALPFYYESLGFERRSAKIITYASGNSFPMVLLGRQQLDSEAKGR